MLTTWFYIFGSILIVSLLSFSGLFFLSIKAKKINKMLLLLVSFSAGALFGDAFLHLLPEAIENSDGNISFSIYILLGIVLMFVIEKFVHWHHCHNMSCESHTKVKSFAFMNLVGDGLHNFIDGLIIAASYTISLPLGIATTVAVILHEIPQEVGDFGVLVHGGYTRFKALLLNFLSALVAVFGGIFALFFSNYSENFIRALIPFAAGSFIYIAGSDLIPELHKEVRLKKSFLQFIFFLAGIGIMLLLLLVE